MRSVTWTYVLALVLGCNNKIPDDLDTGVASQAATDADSDGIVEADDCDDSDATLGGTAEDGDCDGALTADDCDDADDTLGAMANDADCDGTPTQEDCDDEDADSTVRVSDADCDGFVTVDDCDDNNAAVHPDAVEDCATVFDDNCNGDANDLDALTCTVFFVDADSDSFGGEDSECRCDVTEDHSSLDSTDCDDGDASIYPGATEIGGDEIDQDCVPSVIWLEEGDSATHLNIMLTNDEAISGFQLELDTTGFSAASGGAAADAGFALTFGTDILLGFSFSGATLPVGADRVLAEIETTTTPGEACLVGVVLSSPAGVGIPFEIGACAGY